MRDGLASLSQKIKQKMRQKILLNSFFVCSKRKIIGNVLFN
jgi:hypothetical protein